MASVVCVMGDDCGRRPAPSDTSFQNRSFPREAHRRAHEAYGFFVATPIGVSVGGTVLWSCVSVVDIVASVAF